MGVTGSILVIAFARSYFDNTLSHLRVLGVYTSTEITFISWIQDSLSSLMPLMHFLLIWV
mgnify:CR=1 FL=1